MQNLGYDFMLHSSWRLQRDSLFYKTEEQRILFEADVSAMMTDIIAQEGFEAVDRYDQPLRL